MTLLETMIILWTVGLIVWLLLKVIWNERKEYKENLLAQSKKYTDKMDEVQRQYLTFDEDIEKANKEIEELKTLRNELRQKIWYRNRRIEKLEDLLVIADWNKRHKAWRKFTD